MCCAKKIAGVLFRTVFRRTISVQNRALLSECRFFSQERMCVRGFSIITFSGGFLFRRTLQKMSCKNQFE